MVAPTIPAANTQAVNTVASTQNFTPQWWDFFNSLTTGPLGPVQLVGMPDGSDAPAGIVGEYLSSFLLAGGAINLTNNTDTQIISLALTAGDWDLWGELFFTRPTGTGLIRVTGAINSVVSTTPTVPADGVDLSIIDGASNIDNMITLNGLRTRASITTPTTYLLVANVGFTGGTFTAYGALRARRVR